jgi:hypothetical protein
MIGILIAGGAIGAVGYVVLYFVFRAFGTKSAGSSSHIGLIAALLGFVFLCCIGLFALAYSAG